MANYSTPITVYTNTPTSDGSGGTVASWNAGVQTWADVDVLSDQKVFYQGEEKNVVLYLLQMRAQNIAYVPPVENYYITLQTYGPNGTIVNRTLKIISAAQPDLKSYNQKFSCIESNS